MLVRPSNVHATAAGKDTGSNHLKKKRKKENCVYILCDLTNKNLTLACYLGLQVRNVRFPLLPRLLCE